MQSLSQTGVIKIMHTPNNCPATYEQKCTFITPFSNTLALPSAFWFLSVEIAVLEPGGILEWIFCKFRKSCYKLCPVQRLRARMRAALFERAAVNYFGKEAGARDLESPRRGSGGRMKVAKWVGITVQLRTLKRDGRFARRCVLR